MSDKQKLKDTVTEYKKARRKIDTAVTEAAKKVNQTRQEQKE